MNDRLKLTAQQRAAIDLRDVSIALSAGAGCGKTFVLTRRFLEHLQPAANPDPLSGIVAITFTDRAAREMRDRIRSECHEALEKCPQDEVDHWLRILRGLDTARVSTIHSFCAGLLRTHAVAAGIDPNFAVLEQATGEAFLRRAVSESVLDLLSAHDEDCMRLVLDYGLERTQNVLRALVRGRFQVDVSRFDGLSAEALAQAWRDYHREQFIRTRQLRFVESASVRRVLKLLEANEPSNLKMQKRRAFLLETLPAPTLAGDVGSALAELQRAAQVRGAGGEGAWHDKRIYEQIKRALGELRKEINRLGHDLEFDDGELQEAAETSLRALRLTRKVGADYDQRKTAAGMLDFDDLLLLTRNLLRDCKPVRDRAAAGIDLLMIDEFQDTDPVQSEIVRLLCGDRLFDGSLFLVGDVKQSIYRFRRADPHVFTQLRSQIPEPGRLPLSTNFRSQPAILDFVNCLFSGLMGPEYEPLRPHVDEQLSPTPAIEFLFASPKSDNEKDSADRQRQREAEWLARRLRALLDDETPRVRDQVPETGEVTLRPVQPGDVAILFRGLNNVGIYEEALRRHDLSYYLVGGRAFYAQQEIYDLVNLCQYLDDCDDEVSLIGALRSPFFSLSDDSLLALLAQPKPARSQAAERDDDNSEVGRKRESENPSTPREPFARNRSQNSRRTSSATGRPNLTAALQREPPAHLPEKQQRQIRHARDVLAELRERKDRLPLAELLNTALERTGYDASLLNEFLGRRKLANLRKLIDMARQFDRTGLHTLKDFVVRLRDAVVEETHEELAPTHPEKSDVIRLMTVHQAKGLEFPVVVVADMNWQPGGDSLPAHFHPQLGPLLPPGKVHATFENNVALEMHKFFEGQQDDAETVRLLYVAATRAADLLILSAGLPVDAAETAHDAPGTVSRSLSKSPWLRMLAERFDLQNGHPVLDPRSGRMMIGDVPAERIPDILVHGEPPNAQAKTPRQREAAPLMQFEKSVLESEPGDLPATFGAIAPRLTEREVLSVTDIRRAADGSPVCETAASAMPGEDDGGMMPHWDEDFDSRDAQALGTLVHAALERIDFTNPGRLESIVESCLSIAGGTVGNTLRNAAVRRLQRFLQSDLLRELTSATRCFRELEFLLRWPVDSDASLDTKTNRGLTITGQIDCLYELPSGEWRIVDYKTGRMPAGGAKALLEQYELQLTVYAMAAREMIGRLPDRAELALVHDEVKRIPRELNAEFIAQATTRIELAATNATCGR